MNTGIGFKRICFIFIGIFVFIFISCQPTPLIENFDAENWKKDYRACDGIRQGMAQILKNEKEKLKSLTEIQILTLLGKPNSVELGERNRKIYFYFFEKGIHCENDTATYTGKKIILKFNAVNLITDVAFE